MGHLLPKITRSDWGDIARADSRGVQRETLRQYYQVSDSYLRAVLSFFRTGYREPSKAVALEPVDQIHVVTEHWTPKRTRPVVTEHWTPKRTRPVVPQSLPGSVIRPLTYAELTRGR